jgi:hypothetical protein
MEEVEFKFNLEYGLNLYLSYESEVFMNNVEGSYNGISGIRAVGGKVVVSKGVVNVFKNGGNGFSKGSSQGQGSVTLKKGGEVNACYNAWDPCMGYTADIFGPSSQVEWFPSSSKGYTCGSTWFDEGPNCSPCPMCQE